jgi:hypothetical protein
VHVFFLARWPDFALKGLCLELLTLGRNVEGWVIISVPGSRGLGLKSKQKILQFSTVDFLKVCIKYFRFNSLAKYISDLRTEKNQLKLI